MESILHIQPITRQTKAPLTVGHTKHISFGEKVIEGEEDPSGAAAAVLRLGCPLEDVDHGSTRSHVPLIKTFGYIPDVTRASGNVYLETIHYFKNQRELIPVRTKIQSGPGQGMRLSHLPSLNYARSNICGMDWPVTNLREAIISELLEHDSYFQNYARYPVMDWIRDDLSNLISSSTISDIEFGTEEIHNLIRRFRRQVCEVPYDMHTHHARNVVNAILLEQNYFPSMLYSPDVLRRSITDVVRSADPNPLNLEAFGRIKIEKLPRIDHNPLGFQNILNKIDNIALTDFNVDVIVNLDYSIVLTHYHYAAHRVAIFKDHEIGAYTPESLIHSLVCEETMKEILHAFMEFHSQLDDTAREYLHRHPVKVKLIKTIEDEACILLYKHDSSSSDEPLCGVYFDIALQSLAPLSIVPEFK